MWAGKLLLLSYYHLIFEFNLIIKFTIEIILKCVKTKFILAKNLPFVRKALMLVCKLQDKVSP